MVKAKQAYQFLSVQGIEKPALVRHINHRGDGIRYHDRAPISTKPIWLATNHLSRNADLLDEGNLPCIINTALVKSTLTVGVHDCKIW